MAEQQPAKATDTRDAARQKTPSAPIAEPVGDGVELTEDQLGAASGGAGEAHQMKKALIGNFPR
jgi:hypothetical protein